ncbi:hypothetical protein C8R30_11519 [Nitrosomonas nitrosa]|uniref:Uncharacterized protein n=1 Tax=Nitrosomonas nitrosa TaxID=52442 RepID=A0A1I4MG37_9PROT|nr:hypothetical protein C8R30_11519 [Nitrosomonas nitrosa]SFM01993.1 hypothetical protein SAMN05421880_10462 [Nitrosomonas nitrosa]
MIEWRVRQIVALESFIKNNSYVIFFDKFKRLFKKRIKYLA